jgi:quinol-cytochrome oxidoreductase complex cytochrome b subunit
MFYVFVFGYFWIDAFIEATNTFIIASSACIWYFSPRDPDNINDKIVTGAVSRSVGRTFCYHIGTLAMGSFVLAVVRVMQLIMKYFEEQAKKAGELSKLM